MKPACFLIALLFAVCTARSQTLNPIDSFAGIKFGSGKGTVSLLATNTGAVPLPAESKKNVLAFSNFKFGNRMAETVYFVFSDERFCEARAYFKPDLQQQAIILYDRLKYDLSLRYGEGTETKRFSSPYTEGDGNELTAIELGKGTYATNWVEDKVNGKYNTVDLRINSDMYTSVTVTDVRSARPRK